MHIKMRIGKGFLFAQRLSFMSSNKKKNRLRQRLFNFKHRTSVGCGGEPPTGLSGGAHSRLTAGPTDVLEALINGYNLPASAG